MGIGKLNVGGNPVMDWHPKQRAIEKFLVASCYRNWPGINSSLMGHLAHTGLSLSAGCQLNSPAKKEVIVGWILVSDHSLKNDLTHIHVHTYIL